MRGAETDADLSVSTIDDPDPVAAGDSLAYNISVFNSGPAAATAVTLTDTLPEGSTFQSATPAPAGSCGEDLGIVTCSLGSIEPFAAVSVEIVVTAPTSTGTVTNTASASAAEVDPAPDDNTWSESTEVVTPQADLSVQQLDDPDPVATGDPITYSVHTVNLGPLDATGVTLTDSLPAGVTFVSATPVQGGSCGESAGIVTCDLGSVEAFESVTVEIVVTAPGTTGTITNVASVDAVEDDLNPDDNSWSEETTVSLPGADLEVTQSDSSDPAPFGTDITYSVTVSNIGPSDATGVTLTDTLPDGASFVSATPAQGTCAPSVGVVTCDLGGIPRGGSVLVDVVVTAPSESTTITNTASAAGSPSDPDSSDNTSEETTDVRPPCFPAVCIDNGVVLLAVNPEGHLNAEDGNGSNAGPGDVGLMFIPTGSDSTSPGCLCEGWGAADAGSAVTGYANVSTDSGVNGMVLESFTSTPSTAQSTVNIQDTLRVTHDYHPAEETASLYEATVTIENLTDGGLTDIRYRRVMDWDVEPTAFSEFVTIDGGSATNLLFDSNDGFGTANPLGDRTDIGFTGDFVDQGPADHGALFDFGFGALAVGASVSFNIYYGAAADEAGALTAINAVGAEVYSMGQPSTEDGPTLGTPNTFVFAFAGVGGDPIFSPIAVDDVLTVAEDTSGSLNVLANDSDPDDDPITLTESTDPVNGTAVCEADGDCTYTPDVGFVGTDTFDYTITDGNGGFDTATVTVTVEGQNSPPTVDAGGPYLGDEGADVPLDGTVTDPDAGDAVTTTWIYAANAGVDAGATCAFAEPSEVDTTVACTDDGTYTLTLTADDGVNTGVVDMTTLTLDNVGPTVVIDQPSDGSNHISGSPVDLSASIDDDGANDTHACSIDWGDGGEPEAGIVDAGACTGQHTYGDDGSYTLTVAVTDDDLGEGSDSVQISVGANDPPDAVDDDATTNETRPVTIDVLANDTDPESSALTITDSTDPTDGAADCSSGFECVYTPDPGFVGEDSFSYTASDGELTDTATVTVTVVACPILSAAIDGAGIVTGQEWIACSSPNAHAAATFSPDGMPLDGASLGLMTSGTTTGVDGEPGDGASQANGLSLRGAEDVSILRLDLLVPEQATCLSFNLVFGSEEYPEFVGSYNDAFLAEIDLSNWTVVGNEITAPQNIAFDHNGGVVSVNSAFFDESTVVTDNGTAYDGSTGVLEVRSPITPGAHQLYLSIFDANDEILDSGAFVDGLVAFDDLGEGCEAGANQPPSAANDSLAVDEDSEDNILDVLANDGDPDTDTVELSAITTQPEHGVASINPETQRVLYTPDPDYNGPDAFAYRITDGRGGFSTATVSLTVRPINDAPTATDGTATTEAGASVQIDVAPLVDDVETDDADLAYAITTQPANGQLTGSGPIFTYTPNPGFSGPDSFSYQVTDRGDPDACTPVGPACSGPLSSTIQSVAITVTPASNTPPSVEAGGDYTGDEGSQIDLDGTVNDPDAGDSVTTTWSFSPGVGVDPGASCAFGSVNTVDTTVSCNDDGTYTLTLTADDGVNPPVVDTATLTLANDDPAVVINSPGEGASFGAGATVSLDATVADVGGNDILTCNIDWGDTTIEPGVVAGGICTGSHAYTEPGPYTITVTVSDDDDGSGTDTVAITVTSVSHRLTVSLAGDGSGSVMSDPAGIDCPDDCSEDYAEGTPVTLTAEADDGSTFTGWSGDCSGTGSCEVTMSAARNVTATFDLVPASANLSVTQTDTPDPVTSGNAVHYFLTVTNFGPDDATGVVLEDTLPDGSTLVSAESPGCTSTSTTVTCTIGALGADQSVNISIVVMSPTVSIVTTMTNVATVSGNEDDPATANNSHAEMTSVQPVSDDPDAASGWITANGGTVATNAAKPPTKKDPMTTSVTVPPGFPGLVTIVEGPITSCPPTAVCFGQQAEITAPTTTASQPLRLVFSHHPGSLPPSTQLREITMFHDGVEVERCTSESGVASPDPCILSVERVKGAVTITVLSSENGSWVGGR